jgi:hypothetical protein
MKYAAIVATIGSLLSAPVFAEQPKGPVRRAAGARSLSD